MIIATANLWWAKGDGAGTRWPKANANKASVRSMQGFDEFYRKRLKSIEYGFEFIVDRIKRYTLIVKRKSVTKV